MEVLRLETLESNLVPKLRKKFEIEFRYGPDGVPKIWQPGDDIDSAYRKAREKVESFIPIVSKIRLLGFEDVAIKDVVPFKVEEEDDLLHEKLVLITDAHQKNVSMQFQKEIELLFIDAKRSVVSGTTSIPPYVLLLLLILGWNELMAVLSSPLLLLLVLFVGGGLFILHQLQYFGPVEEMVWTIGRQVVTQGYHIVNQGIAAATSASNTQVNANSNQQQQRSNVSPSS